MIGKYTAKFARDAGLAATMWGLALTGDINQEWLKWIAIVCAAGSTLTALSRGPLMIRELGGYASGIRSGLTSRIGGAFA